MKTTKKILIFGCRGMLGSYITRLFINEGYDVIPTCRIFFDIAKQIDKLTKYLHMYSIGKDDIIINCAGIIPQKSLNVPKQEVMMVNAVFPHALQKECEIRGTKLIHISTDCVFSGERGDYTEDDKPDPNSLYGKSKLIGEPPNACVLRTSILGEERNSSSGLLEWVRTQKGNTISGYVDHHWNGFTCLDIAKFLSDMIEINNLWTGVRHVHSVFAYNKFEILNFINDLYNLGIKVERTSTLPVDRRLKSKYGHLVKETGDLKKQLLEMYEYNLFNRNL
jgi:dTDP-4-dehydrorhamnose reductase